MKNKEFIKSVSLDGEEWRDVLGYENLYSVSSKGRIVSKERVVPTFWGTRTIPPKLLNPSIKKDGYCHVILCNGKNRKYVKVHRLVAIAFIPNPKCLPMIDHIDRNRHNNEVENLRWCTLSENMNNPLTIEHCRQLNTGRERKEQYKPVVALKDGIVVKQYDSIKSAIKDGYRGCAISNVCAGRDNSHYGYKWMFLSDYESLVNQNVKERLPNAGLS